MKKANNCYECEYYTNTFDKNNNIASVGLCLKVSCCGGDAYKVAKNQKYCIFESPGRRLSIKEIKQRYERGKNDHMKFRDYLDRASKIVQSWPEWKRSISILGPDEKISKMIN
jgi:hypothetical protein